ncbi:MAG: SGNH/GDSL hydrolase family protein [Isosphaeraceae bacterium]
MPIVRAADPPKTLQGVKRVVFLGDSITYAGQYIELVETWVRLRHPDLRCEFLNLGLPSETTSGLTEPGHAGGAFPRPDVHERLERVLEQTKPDLVVACYGMNDGIYHPLSKERFERYQAGIRKLRERVAAHGARVVHLTPPVFDPTPIRDRTLPAGREEYRQPYEGYDQVVDRYSQWLLDQRSADWHVIDVHGPMKAYLESQRKKDPGFILAGDGVHANATGHSLIARAVLTDWGVALPASTDLVRALDHEPHGTELLRLVSARQRVLRDAWLNAVGHKRPGMARGVPLDQARAQAETTESAIRKLLDSAR